MARLREKYGTIGRNINNMRDPIGGEIRGDEKRCHEGVLSKRVYVRSINSKIVGI